MTKKINLLYIIQSFNNGGAETLAIRLADNLDKARFHTTVCGLCDDGPLKKVLISKDIPYVSLKKREGIDWSMVSRIRSLLRSMKIDLVHTHNQGPLLYTALATMTHAHRVKLIHTEHIDISKELSYSRKHRLFNYLALKRIHGFISIADHLSVGYKKSLHRSDLLFTTINNSVPLPDIDNDPSGKGLHEEIGIDGDRPVIGNISALRPQKDHATLIQAMGIVRKNRPDAVLVIAGDGELNTELMSLTSRQGLTDNVHFLGYRSDVDNLLSRFDMFVLSSLYEGLPLCVLEAMAAARPVVATDVDGTRAIVRHGKTGLLVPVGHPEKLANAILYLLENDTHAAQMGHAGRQMIQDHYNLETMIRRYEAFYRQVLK